MKIGIITTPNTKGQIVIPKKYRDALDIDETVSLNLLLQGEGLYIHPVASVHARKNKEQLLEVLKRTRGAWSGEKGWKERERKQRKLELEASKRRNAEW